MLDKLSLNFEACKGYTNEHSGMKDWYTDGQMNKRANSVRL